MSEKRDPHLPPPEVVDWLLRRSWSKEIDQVRVQARHEESLQFNMRESTFAVGRDEFAQVLMPTSALRVLHRDAALRGTLPLPGDT